MHRMKHDYKLIPERLPMSKGLIVGGYDKAVKRFW